MRTSLRFWTSPKKQSVNTRGFWTARCTIMENFLKKLWNRLCSNYFHKESAKCPSDPTASCCMAHWELTFFSLQNCCIQMLNLGYDLSEPNLSFTLLAATPTFVLELLIVHIAFIILLSRMIITRNECRCLHILLWSSTTWRLQQRLQSFPPNENSSSKQTFSTMLQFVGLLSQWKQSLHSLDGRLKNLCGINILISDKVEDSEVVKQL